MQKIRLDILLAKKGWVTSRSQAESFIRLGEVEVDGEIITKPGYFVAPEARVKLKAAEQYVSRAALKLASVAEKLKLDFKGKTILDVGSSTGGFTQYALKHGAKKVIAVDVGTDQLHPSLRPDTRIELHEQTDIRDMNTLSSTPDIVVIDVSFISLREVLPHLLALIGKNTQVAAMVKPQFEAGERVKHKGVIKNDRMRRQILQEFENWVKKLYIVCDKADSGVSGAKGNQERFYLLTKP